MAKILVVDDHPANREFLRTLLTYKGYEIHEASDGAEALGLARNTRPDLIITDILMPTMDGYEFVRQLRLDPDIANTAVVFCTADYHGREAQNLAKACGVANLLFKPCEPELVLQTVESALGVATVSSMPAPSQQFDRDHLALLTNKLSQKTTELQTANQRLSALIEISVQLAAEPDSARLVEGVCRSARDLIGARYAMAAASEGASDTPEHFFTSGFDGEIARNMGTPLLREGVLGTILEEQRAVRRCGLPEVSGPGGLPAHFPTVRSLLAVPIASRSRTYGWLCLGDKVGGQAFTEEDERLATILGTQVGRIYENVTLYDKARHHAAELEREGAQRQQVKNRLRMQLSRLDLLHRITRAIAERQDLRSIFQVVIRNLEDNLPIDFGCFCLYEPAEQMLTVNSVGTRGALAAQLEMTVEARIAIDGLSHCVQGQLSYEPNIDQVPFAFQQRLARGGLGALVVAPLLAESKVFGVLVAARRQPESFSSSDCEFLRQLSEHVGLAAHQAQLYTALQSAYEDLRQSQHNVMQQERLRAMGQMASGVAHDINNAMSPAALYTESLLEFETSLSDRARGYLVTIRRAIDDVAQTVSRMRDFCRPREAQFDSVPVSLNCLVEQVIEFTRVRWKDVPQQRGTVIDVRAQLEPGLSDIMGTESEIRGALTNLVFNAVDAMSEGGALTIRTRTSAAQSEVSAKTVSLEVTDSGGGMDEETRRRCLEPFFTTKGERGTGLGLAMVYGMARRHGAEMGIDSALGKGTTVRLIFQAAPEARGSTSAQPLAMPKQSLSILVVDDDPLIIDSLRTALESDGHRVTVADGGQAGMDTFVAAQRCSETFAVVITDLGMPDVDGYKVADTVKANSPATPVILLTGWGQRLTADNAIPAHVDCVLSKPPKVAELRRALAELTVISGPSS